MVSNGVTNSRYDLLNDPGHFDDLAQPEALLRYTDSGANGWSWTWRSSRMANLNLVFLGVLVGAAGGTIGLLVLILIHHELFVHRRPRVVIAFVLLITGLSVLSDGGVAALALCVFSAVCFYGLGLVLRGVLFGDIPSASSDRLPPRPFVRQRRPLNGFQLAKLVAFLALLVAMIVAAKRSYQVHLQEHQPGPSYLEVIKDIESDID